jgi:predicted transcriptional regulator
VAMSSQKLTKVTLKMDATVKKRLDEYCRKNGLKMYYVVSKAIEEYLTKMGA